MADEVLLRNELTDVNSFFSLAQKIKVLAEDCVDWLVEEFKELTVNYSDSTNGNFSELNKFPKLHREGKYFSTDNYRSFWFLGLTVGQDEFIFSLAYNKEGKVNTEGLKENIDFKKVMIGYISSWICL
jgi:hypothetical protein